MDELMKLSIYKAKIENYLTGKSFKTTIAAYSMEDAVEIAHKLVENGWVVWVKDTFKVIIVKEQ